MLAKVVVSNLEYLLRKHGLRASHLVALAKQNELELSKTFMSRLLTGEHDFRASKADALIATLRILEPGLQGYELFVPDYFSKQTECEEITQEELVKVTQKMVMDLVELGWIGFREDIPASAIADMMASALKNNTPLKVTDKKSDHVAV